jgi:hypothetical protein
MQQQNDNSTQRAQQGSGSAENTGRSREEQKNRTSVLTQEERNDIANQVQLQPEDIADLQQTGALSGRDDAAGSSGDRMEATNSNEPTERF